MESWIYSKFRSKKSVITTISTNFLPANLKVGTGFDFILDDYNKVAVNLELINY
jgi:hypothetical protein